MNVLMLDFLITVVPILYSKIKRNNYKIKIFLVCDNILLLALKHSQENCDDVMVMVTYFSIQESL